MTFYLFLHGRIRLTATYALRFGYDWDETSVKKKRYGGDFFSAKNIKPFFFSTKLETCDEIQLLKYNPGATWNYKSLLSIWGKSEFPLFKLGFYEEQTLEKAVICLGNKGHLFCLVR